MALKLPQRDRVVPYSMRFYGSAKAQHIGLIGMLDQERVPLTSSYDRLRLRTVRGPGLSDRFIGCWGSQRRPPACGLFCL